MAKTIIGKDVIESLTLGMYEDPRVIFREYIQNSADQIDIALAEGLISSIDDGIIDIDIQKQKKEIIIRDNGTGIQEEKVEFILKNIAQGVKDRNKHKGFRGIGRLGGLAYCDKLIFETSYMGEPTKSILTWDSKKLKDIINNRDNKEEATQVIDTITSFRTEKEDIDCRYFKVIMTSVSNPILLDKHDIRQYLSMVAPIPYPKGFIFSNHIYEKAKEYNYPIDEYTVYVNKDQLYKLYTTSIYEGEDGSKKKIDQVHNIEFFDYKNKHSDVVFWGWYSISNYSKQIPKANEARGIRLRKSNIQIGLDNCLVKLFKEPRGSYYFFGEVFAVDNNLIPNARRDYFLDNETLSDFEKQLRYQFTELHKLYHFSSNIRSAQKKVDKVDEFKKKIDEKFKNGFTNKEEQRKYEDDFNKIKEEAIKAQEKLEKEGKKINEEGSNSQKNIFRNVVKTNGTDVKEIGVVDANNGKVKFITDDISNLNRKDRKLISRIFVVIDTVLTPDLAENLKYKIKEDLKN